MLAGIMLANSAWAVGPLATVQQRAEMRGYRVREVRWDPVLHQRWAVLESVAHPELPLLSEPAESGADGPAEVTTAVNGVPVFKVAELAVRPGDRVILWGSEKNMRMQMGAIAEGNGTVGDRIQLRVTGAGVNGDTGWRVSGIVRGPGSVELER